MRKSCCILVAVSVLAVASVASAQAWKITLPEGALGFNFGNLIIPDLKNVMSKTAYTDEQGYGFVSVEGLSMGGSRWPDPLSGTYVGTLTGKPYEFRAKVPNGDYLVWLSAGKIIRGDLKGPHFLLKCNDTVLCDETPTVEQLAGEKYLYRFLRTQYSEKPHGLWERYIDVMYPSATLSVKVTGGQISLSAANHFLSALVLVPAAKKAEFDGLVATIQKKRMDEFEKSCPIPAQAAPAKPEGAGDFILFVPQDTHTVMPGTSPTEEERKAKKIEAAGARGQRVLMTLAVTPFADLGKCSLVLADLKGPGTIPASAIQGYFKNYRWGRDAVSEMALVPSLTLDVESGITQSFWLLVDVPADARPGVYRGTFTFRPEKAPAADIPVEFEVYPFKLEPVLPVAYGFWGLGYTPSFLPAELQRNVMKERFEAMRQTGFTSFTLEGPTVLALNKDGTVRMGLDPMLFELAKETGMARHPEQALCHPNYMAAVGRPIAARLPGVGNFGNGSGVELKHPDFKKYFMDTVRQYHDFIQKMGLPVVVTSVDEPRERRLNSWNRDFDATVAYCDMLHEGGLRVCVNPMRDTDHYVNKDYVPFLDHVDVLSTHAWEPSKRFMTETLARKKTLWLYNCGKDRYSWGFYNWRAKSNGRWEWHFCWFSDSAEGGYPGREWYNPFTGLTGLAPSAPYATCKGGILYQSPMLDMAEGITDYAYVYTLTETLKKPGKNPQTVEKAKTFLAALERAMPAFPQLKGMASQSDGAAVGMGIDDEARRHTAEWRKTIAGFLKDLKD